MKRDLTALTAKLRSTGVFDVAQGTLILNGSGAAQGTSILNGSGANGLDDDIDLAVEVVECTLGI